MDRAHFISFMDQFIHLFSGYLVRTYHMLESMGGPKALISGGQSGHKLCLQGACFPEGKVSGSKVAEG